MTQSQFEKLMARNPSRHAPGNKEKKKTAGADTSNHPVDSVNWEEVQEFCDKLSQAESLPAGAGYGVPSEAQWEYACRAGTFSEFWSGGEIAGIERAAWYFKNSGDRTHPVGLKAGNAFGLYDVRPQRGQVKLTAPIPLGSRGGRRTAAPARPDPRWLPAAR